MFLKLIKLLAVFMLSSMDSYSQSVDSKIKNTMVEFLYKHGQYDDSDIKFLAENTTNKNSILFWLDEIPNSCDVNLRVFKFGTSKEHSKEFLMLVKNENEILFLGNEKKKELEENLFYNFVRFYNTEVLLCFLTGIYKKEVIPVYQHNFDVIKNNYINFPQVF